MEWTIITVLFCSNHWLIPTLYQKKSQKQRNWLISYAWITMHANAWQKKKKEKEAYQAENMYNSRCMIYNSLNDEIWSDIHVTDSGWMHSYTGKCTAKYVILQFNSIHDLHVHTTMVDCMLPIAQANCFFTRLCFWKLKQYDCVKLCKGQKRLSLCSIWKISLTVTQHPRKQHHRIW